jgi:predicted ABC-type ATPase
VENKSPQIIVIAGPNGAGKSTLAPHLLKDTFGLLEYVNNADTIAHGLSAFNPEGVAFEAGRVMLERLHSLAEQQKSFAYETTLATRSYAVWLSRLKHQGYRFHLLYLWLRSPELALYRIRE